MFLWAKESIETIHDVGLSFLHFEKIQDGVVRDSGEGQLAADSQWHRLGPHGHQNTEIIHYYTSIAYMIPIKHMFP